ncbi:rRNA-processing protein FYV7 [Heracleum sosnowskyi]|uniref:rRNA-processing protein FYV7 n=1 Tax=Heracleum sosnowskyi TaxID=360622 RepID=A0AAD8J6W4_9APIA|nr:rRNA-processing protein FYV7 [Heracleum sosnowskyi]
MMKKNEMGQDKNNKGGKFKRPESMASKNKMRMGGKGLSLEAFANAKSKTDYNPALIKKKREFYKNAKYVSNYKKLKKHENFPNDPSFPDLEPPKDKIEPVRGLEGNQERKKKKESARSLNEVYERKRKEQEKVRNEKEAIIQAKKERKEQSQSQRKALREKMLKRTRSGQPVMKYRIEHMLEKIQGSKS